MIDWKKLSEFEGPEQSPGFRLWKLSTLWRRQAEAALLKVGLTHPQFVLLAVTGWLTREGTQIKQVDLAKRCGTDINMTSQVLRTLERKGYLKRVQADGRSKYLQLTEEGKKMVLAALPLVEEVDKEFFAHTDLASIHTIS